VTLLRRLFVLALPLLWCGCTDSPSTLQDCADRGDPGERDRCLELLLAQGQLETASVREALTLASDPAVRDLLLLRLVVLEPWSAQQLCPELASERASSWCRDVQARPHVWKGRQR